MDLELAHTHTATTATDLLYEKLKRVITPQEWEGYVQDVSAIQKLKQQRNAIILAHNYMTPEVFYCVADIVGDSLALAREAEKADADVIVQAGVHFMAETAKLLNPSRTVLSPDLNAGCSLSESITAMDVHNLRKQYPGVPVVTYVNTSAAVKAEADICCTSGNAKKIVESLGAPSVIMLPDDFLANNVAAQTNVKIITWKGRCEVHERFTAKEIRACRSRYSELVVVAHPECPPEVVAEADFAGSTVGMSDWVKDKKPKRVLLITENSMSDNMSVAYPDVEFIRPEYSCPYMKLITLKSIRNSLETMTHEIHVPEDIAVRARVSVERMIAVH